MNKRILLILLFMIALMTMAQECQSNGKDTKSNRATFIGGTSGLSIQFAEEAPPAEVFDLGQDHFSVDLILLNVGEADISKSNVKVTLSGLNPPDFGKTESDFIQDGIQQNIESSYIDSEGNKITAPEVIVTFPNLNYKSALTGNRVWPIWVDVCYSYYTKAETDGCIKRDVRGTDTSTVCVVNEKKKIDNSGAPIQVTEFQEVPSGTDRVKYFFTIKHVGTGNVFLSGSKCGNDRSNENKVFVKISSSVSDLQCSGFLEGNLATEGTVLLRNGEITVRCTQEKASQIDYVDPISVKLDYDYRQSVKQDILVKKSS